jgi:hypothetical protein
MRLSAIVLAVSPLITVATAAAADIKPLPLNGVYDSQLGGAYDPAPEVTIISRDREAAPVAGLYNICYVNAFQIQPTESEWWKAKHLELLLMRRNGTLVEDENWPGEILLDTTTSEKRAALAEIIGGWIEQCATDGFDAVEPDNLDTWTRSYDLISLEDNLAFAALLAERAHSHGLAIAQKNAAELGTLGRDAGFDFAIVEECQVWAECEDYMAVYGDAILEIEYTDEDRAFFEVACTARGFSVAVVLRDRDLTPAGHPDHTYEQC